MFGDHDKPSVGVRKAQHEAQSTEIRKQLQQIKNKIIVMSGKGGVGKSSVAAYLSVVLAQKGYRIGLMDVDLHGPSIARLLGLHAQVCTCSRKGHILPVNLFSNLAVISIETLTGGQDAATIWRGPLKGAAIRQFIADIAWGQLDYLVIDLFKTKGGLSTASKENLPLLGCLPLEPEVVQRGDQGHLQELTYSTLPYAQEFSRMVDAILASTEPELKVS